MGGMGKFAAGGAAVTANVQLSDAQHVVERYATATPRDEV
jgi:hypothetical protein